MKEIKLYANVNPLEPHTMLQVATSQVISSTKIEDWEKVINEKREYLKSLGFRTYLEYITKDYVK